MFTSTLMVKSSPERPCGEEVSCAQAEVGRAVTHRRAVRQRKAARHRRVGENSILTRKAAERCSTACGFGLVGRRGPDERISAIRGVLSCDLNRWSAARFVRLRVPGLAIGRWYPHTTPLAIHHSINSPECLGPLRHLA